MRLRTTFRALLWLALASAPTAAFAQTNDAVIDYQWPRVNVTRGMVNGSVGNYTLSFQNRCPVPWRRDNGYSLKVITDTHNLLNFSPEIPLADRKIEIPAELPGEIAPWSLAQFNLELHAPTGNVPENVGEDLTEDGCILKLQMQHNGVTFGDIFEQSIEVHRPVVRFLYLVPNNRKPQNDWQTKMGFIATKFQQLLREDMERNGVEDKNLNIQTDQYGAPKFYLFDLSDPIATDHPDRAQWSDTWFHMVGDGTDPDIHVPGNWEGDHEVGVHLMTASWEEGGGLGSWPQPPPPEPTPYPGATWASPSDTNIANYDPDGSTWNMELSPPFIAEPTSVRIFSHTNQDPEKLIGPNKDVSWDVTDDVQGFLDPQNPVPNYGWCIKKENESTGGHVTFFSRETLGWVSQIDPELLYSYSRQAQFKSPKLRLTFVDQSQNLYGPYELEASKDTYLRRGRPDRNQGKEYTFAIRRGKGGEVDLQRALIAFDQNDILDARTQAIAEYDAANPTGPPAIMQLDAAALQLRIETSFVPDTWASGRATEAIYKVTSGKVHIQAPYENVRYMLCLDDIMIRETDGGLIGQLGEGGFFTGDVLALADGALLQDDRLKNNVFIEGLDELGAWWPAGANDTVRRIADNSFATMFHEVGHHVGLGHDHINQYNISNGAANFMGIAPISGRLYPERYPSAIIGGFTYLDTINYLANPFLNPDPDADAPGLAPVVLAPTPVFNAASGMVEITFSARHPEHKIVSAVVYMNDLDTKVAGTFLNSTFIDGEYQVNNVTIKIPQTRPDITNPTNMNYDLHVWDETGRSSGIHFSGVEIPSRAQPMAPIAEFAIDRQTALPGQPFALYGGVYNTNVNYMGVLDPNHTPSSPGLLTGWFEIKGLDNQYHEITPAFTVADPGPPIKIWRQLESPGRYLVFHHLKDASNLIGTSTPISIEISPDAPDHSEFSLEVDSNVVTENAGSGMPGQHVCGRVRLQRNAAMMQETLKVRLVTFAIEAGIWADFEPLDQTLTFEPGETQKDFSIAVWEDDAWLTNPPTLEPDERFRIELIATSDHALIGPTSPQLITITESATDANFFNSSIWPDPNTPLVVGQYSKPEPDIWFEPMNLTLPIWTTDCDYSLGVSVAIVEGENSTPGDLLDGATSILFDAGWEPVSQWALGRCKDQINTDIFIPTDDPNRLPQKYKITACMKVNGFPFGDTREVYVKVVPINSYDWNASVWSWPNDYDIRLYVIQGSEAPDFWYEMQNISPTVWADAGTEEDPDYHTGGTLGYDLWVTAAWLVGEEVENENPLQILQDWDSEDSGVAIPLSEALDPAFLPTQVVPSGPVSLWEIIRFHPALNTEAVVGKYKITARMRRDGQVFGHPHTVLVEVVAP